MKIAVIVDIGNVIQNRTDCIRTMQKLQALTERTFNEKSNTVATILPTKAALACSYVRMQVAAMRSNYGWEVGMSDPSPGVNIADYSYADQLAMLSECKYYAQHAYHCGDPLPDVLSYLPQGRTNQDTEQVLTNLGITHVAVPNCRSIPEAQALLDTGQDIVLCLNTADLPAPTFGYPPTEYPIGSKHVIENAKAKGAQFVQLNQI